MFLAVALLSTGCLDVAWAQGGPGAGMGGGQGRMASGRMYDPQTVETVAGEVVSVDRVAWGRRGQGVHLTLNTGKETLSVHLGPSWYVDQQAVKIAAKDRIQVTGSRVDFQGKKALVAAEVKKDGQVLKLRDAQGIPAWAGQGRGRRR
jgi:hypothetical protein